MDVPLRQGGLILLRQALDVGPVHAVGEQVLLILCAAVRRGAHRLDGEAEVRVDLFAQYFLYSILLRWIVLLGWQRAVILGQGRKRRELDLRSVTVHQLGRLLALEVILIVVAALQLGILFLVKCLRLLQGPTVSLVLQYSVHALDEVRGL